MPDEMVVRHCALPLASNRTESLFSCPCGSEKVICGVRELNQRLRSKGLRVLTLRRGNEIMKKNYRGGVMVFENCSRRF